MCFEQAEAESQRGVYGRLFRTRRPFDWFSRLSLYTDAHPSPGSRRRVRSHDSGPASPPFRESVRFWALTVFAHSRPRALVCIAGSYLPSLDRGCSCRVVDAELLCRVSGDPGSLRLRAESWVFDPRVECPTIVLRRVVGADLYVERSTIAKRLPRIRSKSWVFSSDAKLRRFKFCCLFIILH